jgi:hypothetical protein
MKMTQAERSARYRKRKREQLDQVERLEQRIRELERPLDEVIAGRMTKLKADDLMIAFEALPDQEKAAFISTLWWRGAEVGIKFDITFGGNTYSADFSNQRSVPTLLDKGGR